jgi:two-component system LytT family response regulator
MVYKAVLVDDEKLALKRLQRLLRDEPDVEIIGAAENGRDAVALIEDLKPDILFLDIQMPGMTGFDVIRRLKHVPVVIFTTAYDEYALEAFETTAVDYLLKPVEKARLHRAIDKLKRLQGGESSREIGDKLDRLLQALGNRQKQAFLTHVPAKIGDRILVFAAGDIAYFYASDKYTFLVAGDRELIIDRTLAELEAALDPGCFVRIHRGTIVNVAFVKEIVSLLGGRYLCRLKQPPRDLPVSRSMVGNLRQFLQF